MVGEPNIARRTVAFSLRLIRLCQTLEAGSGVSQTLGRQLLRAGTSIGANVHEAQAAQSRADFIAKMSIAQKEARESLYWFELVCQSGLMPEERLRPLMEEADVINRIVAKILVSSKKVNQ